MNYVSSLQEEEDDKAMYLLELINEYDFVLWHPNYSSNWTINTMEDIYAYTNCYDYLQGIIIDADTQFANEFNAAYLLRLMDVWNVSLSHYSFDMLFDSDFDDFDTLMSTLVDLIHDTIIFLADSFEFDSVQRVLSGLRRNNCLRILQQSDFRNKVMLSVLTQNKSYQEGIYSLIAAEIYALYY